jgi:hypothetical protein
LATSTICCATSSSRALRSIASLRSIRNASSSLTPLLLHQEAFGALDHLALDELGLRSRSSSR